MKVYIAGKITGDPNYKGKFAAEQREIRCFRDVCAQSMDRVEHVEELLKAIMDRTGF